MRSFTNFSLSQFIFFSSCHDLKLEKTSFTMTSSNGNISAVLALCAGNSPVPGEFFAQRPVTRSFDVFFDLRPNKWLSKQSWGWWFETPSYRLWRHSNGFWWCAWPSTICPTRMIDTWYCLQLLSKLNSSSVSRLTITGKDNGLSPIRRQAIILTSAWLLSIGPSRINFSQILIQNVSFTEIHMEIPYAWRL